MFKKFNYNNKICQIKPTYLSSTFIRLLHLLTDEDIRLTFEEREKLYKHIDFLIKFLEEKQNNGTNN